MYNYVVGGVEMEEETNKILWLLPFTVLKDKKVNTLIWFICIIMFSNLGVIFLVINAINKGSGISFSEILGLELFILMEFHY
jgi:hypothetical protein